MPTGLYLGQYLETRKRGVLRYPERSHLATIGPTGSGKGMGVICANLGDPALRRSVLVIDPKAQIAAITGRKRARLGRVVMLNPYQELESVRPHLVSNGFNPLARLALKSPRFVAEVTKLADAIIQVDANTTQKHFPESARDLVAALIMWECLLAERERRIPTLGNVRTVLGKSFMMKDGQPYGLLDTMTRISVCQDPHIGASIRAKASKFENINTEIQNVISDALTQTKFLDDPSIRDDLALDGFDFDDMKKEIVTVYLILPTSELKSQSAWMRLVVTAALNSLLRSLPAPHMPPVLLILDEFFQLNLPNFDNTISIARDHGVQLWMILQNLGQLEKMYGSAYQGVLSGCAATTFFRPGKADMFTAEHLSKMCGTTTVVTSGESKSADSGTPGQNSGQTQRRFILPEEFQSQLKRNEMICFVDNVVHPFKSVVPHYKDTAFNEGLDDNPYYTGG